MLPIIYLLLSFTAGFVASDTYDLITKPQPCGEYIRGVAVGMSQARFALVDRHVGMDGSVLAWQDPSNGDLHVYAVIWDDESAGEIVGAGFKPVDVCVTPAGEPAQIFHRVQSTTQEAATGPTPAGK